MLHRTNYKAYTVIIIIYILKCKIEFINKTYIINIIFINLINPLKTKLYNYKCFYMILIDDSFAENLLNSIIQD